ncbi:MAG: 50S ribosomal protein L25 [Chloroflexi bacterium HGW-Chloroflexi-6]|nr:MAG: 50S ribosomal protein L25 [Chloroflexi bacterium HGW-Chloroflexi-6]
MEKVVLKATKRVVIGKQVSALRRQGVLPGVIYGYKVESTAIQMDAHEANLVIPKLTSSSVVTIDLGGKKIPALVRERQKNYIKGHLTHVDFQAISMTEKIRTLVSIHLFGVAPAVKEHSAVIVSNITALEVEALPHDLPERIELDISTLLEIGNAIHVRDIELPKEVEVLTDLDEVVVVAAGTAAGESEADGEAAEAEPELVEKKKKEDEE